MLAKSQTYKGEGRREELLGITRRLIEDIVGGWW
jgi:hypothetical protein